MGRILLTPPTEEPVTLAEAKLHLREDYNAQDALITSLIKTSRESVEAYTRRALISQKWKLTLDEFPCDEPIDLPFPPLISVESIKYIDPDGTLQTLPIDQYVVDVGSTPGRINLAYMCYWPLTRCEPDAVRIEFTCGYADAASVPFMAKAAMKLAIGHLFENREAVGAAASELPLGFAALLDPLRVPESI